MTPDTHGVRRLYYRVYTRGRRLATLFVILLGFIGPVLVALSIGVWLADVYPLALTGDACPQLDGVCGVFPFALMIPLAGGAVGLSLAMGLKRGLEPV